jgi:hypothetical protein
MWEEAPTISYVIPALLIGLFLFGMLYFISRGADPNQPTVASRDAPAVAPRVTDTPVTPAPSTK